MATFLTLVNLALARINETQLNSSTFSTVASGPALAMIQACNATVADINRREQQWPFNYGKQTFPTIASTVTGVSPSVVVNINNEYTPPSGVTTIKWSTFGVQRNDNVTPAIVASNLHEMDYNAWATRVRPRDLQLSSFRQPEFVIKGDDGQIILSPPPDRVYTIYYDGWSNQAAMVNYNDTCNVPDLFNYIIVDGMIYYGYDFRSDEGAMDRAKKKFDDGVAEMQKQLIKPTDGFQSTQIVNTRTYNSIPSRYGL